MSSPKKWTNLFILIVAIVCSMFVGYYLSKSESADTPSQMISETPEPLVVRDFALFDHQAINGQLSHYAGRKAVVLFIHGVGCPIVEKATDDYMAIAKQYEPSDVAFFFLNPYSQDSLEELKEAAKQFRIEIPILKDDAQIVSQELELTRTAEALIIDTSNWEVVYRGQINDAFNYESEKSITKHYLKDAIDLVLEGKPVLSDSPPAVGCALSFNEYPELSKEDVYSEEIAPLLKEKCALCHRKNGGGPWYMDSYETIYGWRNMIRETVTTNRMPPWNAFSNHTNIQNEISLYGDDKAKLIKWIDNGAPRGIGPDPLLFVEPAPTGWILGEPDAIIQVPTQTVPASGALEYVYVSGLEFENTGGRWLRASQIRHTNTKAVHHSFAFIEHPPEYKSNKAWKTWPSTDFVSYGWISIFIFGIPAVELPKGTGMYIPEGSTLKMQLHYQTYGVAAEDEIEVGLYFHDRPPAAEYIHRIVVDETMTYFEVPPGEQNYVFPLKMDVKAEHGIKIFSLQPHMHYRGKWARYDVTPPNGKKYTLFSMPKYNFNWQRNYILDPPVILEKGTRIEFISGYDNSEFNPLNPDPTVPVNYGDQSEDEMFLGYIGYAELTECEAKGSGCGE